MLTIELYNNTSACMCEFTTTMCYLTLRNKPSIKIFTINWVIVQYVRNLYKFMKKLALKEYVFAYTHAEKRNRPWLVKLWKNIHPHNSQRNASKENAKSESTNKI